MIQQCIKNTDLWFYLWMYAKFEQAILYLLLPSLSLVHGLSFDLIEAITSRSHLVLEQLGDHSFLAVEERPTLTHHSPPPVSAHISPVPGYWPWHTPHWPSPSRNPTRNLQPASQHSGLTMQSIPHHLRNEICLPTCRNQVILIQAGKILIRLFCQWERSGASV